jgi:hypothetical protein
MKKLRQVARMLQALDATARPEPDRRRARVGLSRA